MNMHRRRMLLLAGVTLLTPTARAASQPLVTVYKDPSCNCCSAWADHIARASFPTKIVEEPRMNTIKVRFGIPSALWSCHTAEVENFLLEGHVPAAALARLLAVRPSVRGIAVAGMPVGSPGMDVAGMEPEIYDVMAFGSETPSLFMRFRGTSLITN